jgi:hypothetical protein
VKKSSLQFRKELFLVGESPEGISRIAKKILPNEKPTEE